jgi:hypothetical protein
VAILSLFIVQMSMDELNVLDILSIIFLLFSNCRRNKNAYQVILCCRNS